MKKYEDIHFNQYQKVLDIRIRENQGKKVWQGNLKEKNSWFYGSQGTGKTSFVHNSFNP